MFEVDLKKTRNGRNVIFCHKINWKRISSVRTLSYWITDQILSCTFCFVVHIPYTMGCAQSFCCNKTVIDRARQSMKTEISSQQWGEKQDRYCRSDKGMHQWDVNGTENSTLYIIFQPFSFFPAWVHMTRTARVIQVLAHWQLSVTHIAHKHSLHYFHPHFNQPSICRDLISLFILDFPSTSIHLADIHASTPTQHTTSRYLAKPRRLASKTIPF